MQFSIKANDRICILGQTGSGKTYFAKWLIQKFPKTLIFDTDGEYKSFGKFVHSMKELKEAVMKFDRIVYYPPHYSEAAFEEFNQYVFLNLRGVMLLYEELSNYTSAGYAPFWFNQLFVRGRKRGLGITTTSQRTTLIAKNIISQSEHLDLFHEHEPNALAYLEKLTCAGISEKIKLLKPREFCHYSRGTLTKCAPLA